MSVVDDIIRDVCELTDLPDVSHPDTVVVSLSELRDIILTNLETAS